MRPDLAQAETGLQEAQNALDGGGARWPPFDGVITAVHVAHWRKCVSGLAVELLDSNSLEVMS